MKRLLIFWAMMVCAMLIIIGFLSAASAQRNWSPCDQFIDFLLTSYGEEEIGFGLTTNGAVIRIFVSPTSRTWSAIFMTPAGLCRPLSSGTSWAVGLMKNQGRDVEG